MGLIKIHHPSRRDLHVFGLMGVVFFGLIGGLVWWKSKALGVPTTIWVVGGVLFLCYYAVPSSRLFIYYGWMKLTYPIGWVVSHVLLLVSYYLVITPIGLIMRAFGHDAMHRTVDPDAPTYWVEHTPNDDRNRYFRQF